MMVLPSLLRSRSTALKAAGAPVASTLKLTPSFSDSASATMLLNWFVPQALISPVGWAATIAEVAIAIGLLVGWRLRWFALAAGVVLTIFAIAMAVALGPKPPLDYSVLSAASAAYLLAAISSRTRRVDGR
jgi:hypothetical protein